MIYVKHTCISLWWSPWESRIHALLICLRSLVAFPFSNRTHKANRSRAIKCMTKENRLLLLLLHIIDISVIASIAFTCRMQQHHQRRYNAKERNGWGWGNNGRSYVERLCVCVCACLVWQRRTRWYVNCKDVFDTYNVKLQVNARYIALCASRANKKFKTKKNGEEKKEQKKQK